ncbi:MAG: helix-turn-helix domain-containing protein [Desulfovibrionaceae bacterium]
MGNTGRSVKALSPEAEEALRKLGNQLKEARTKRRMTQEELATRASISAPTLMKLERGAATVGLGALAQVLDVLGLAGDIARVADPDTDTLGKRLQSRSAPKRVRSVAPSDDELDF